MTNQPSEKQVSYAFVLDANDTPLSPTRETKAWYLVRKKRAVLVSKYPLVIRLTRVIYPDSVCKDEMRLGIDDGAEHVGLAITQKCKTRNKVLFKAVLEHRNDVKKKLDVRRSYRRNRRSHKRHRPVRYDNRSASKRRGRIPPSILQKRQAIIRLIDRLSKWIHISEIHLEDVKIDIRALTDGYEPHGWQYQQSNRLDENLRKAAIIRDGYKCRMCGKTNCRLEVHHIIPRRLDGRDTIKNLITLCSQCHGAVTGNEEGFILLFQDMLSVTKIPDLASAQHVMNGKTWLQKELAKRAFLTLTTGGDTANKRIDWNIPKTHANDAICITGLEPDTCDVKEWLIKPIRRKSKAKTDNVLNIRHRDLVSYTYRNGETHTGYVTALYPAFTALNFQSPTKHCKKVNARKCKLLWRFNKFYWLQNDNTV